MSGTEGADRGAGSDRPRVLVGFADATAAIESVWSLEDAGFAVSAFARAGSRPVLRRLSSVDLRPITAPELDVGESVRDLRAAMRECGAAGLMPLDDAALWLCRRAVEGTGWALVGPGERQIEVALDKRLQCEAAARAGFAVAETGFLEAPARPGAGARFPLVVRPAKAVEERHGRLRVAGAALSCGDAGELERAIEGFEPGTPLMIQPRLRGTGEGVFGLATPGGVRAWSAHRRVRMMNPAGSGSSACVSIALEDPVRRRAEAMIAQLEWSGLFMIELLRDDRGQPWFIELNGRAWGSMALARAVGLEYPAWAARLALGEDLGSLPAAPAAPGGGEAVRARHLGREVVHLLAVMRGPRSSAVPWPSRRRSAREVLGWQRGDRPYNWRPGELGVLLEDTLTTIAGAVRGSRRTAMTSVRAAVHVHSDWSYDGSWSLEELSSEFARRGYDAILMTEHDRGFDEGRWRDYRESCAAASAEGALLVPGIEYSDRANLAHLAVWGDLPFLGEARETAPLLADAAGEGGAAMFAHPQRREAWRLLDALPLDQLAGIEVWNRKYDGWAPGLPAARLNGRESRVAPFFGLDFHTRRQFHPIGMVLEVERPGSSDSVVDALLGGRCRPYAFGIDGRRLMGGPGYSLARSAEASRRLIRPGVRRWRRRRGSLTG